MYIWIGLLQILPVVAIMCGGYLVLLLLLFILIDVGVDLKMLLEKWWYSDPE